MSKKGLLGKILKGMSEASKDSSATSKGKIRTNRPKSGGRPCGGCSGK